MTITDTLDAPAAETLSASTKIDRTTRNQIDLTGTWEFVFDDQDTGITDKWFASTSTSVTWTTIATPAAWDLAHLDGFDRQQAAWYRREITTPADMGPIVRLKFEGVFREATVWLDGVKLGGFDLPYLPFSFDITDKLNPEQTHSLVVRIDNRLDFSTLPCDTRAKPGKHGWFPYGGILRPVYLESGIASDPEQVLISTDDEGSFSARIGLSSSNQTLQSLKARLLDTDGSDMRVEWESISNPDNLRGLQLDVKLHNPKLWSPDAPDHVYEFELTSLGADGTTQVDTYQFGFQTFAATDGRFTLNGSDLFLRGMNRHEDHPDLGPVFNSEAFDKDIGLLADLNINFIRPGHYPNDSRVLKRLEGEGVMIAEEIPVYQLDGDQLADPVLIDLSVRALQTMIIRDYNRPGIIMWSVANEIMSWESSAPNFVSTLYKAAKSLDPGRPVMLAALTVPPLTLKDKTVPEVDVVGINQYYGWYFNETDDLGGYLDDFHELYPEKTILISEFGAGTLQGHHIEGPVTEEDVRDHSYSEEYQVYYYEQHLNQISERPFIRGTMPWAFADFRMQWNQTTGKPHPVEKMNLKGLVSFDRKRKSAFSTIRDWYKSGL